MKKMLFALCLVCVTFNCIAQRRNEWGQKMVKSIKEVFCTEYNYTLQTGERECTKITAVKIFDCDYDKNNRLSVFKVTEYCYDQDNNIVTPQETLTFSRNNRTTQKGCIYDTFKYYFNEDGLITKTRDFDGNLNGRCYGNNTRFIYNNNRKLLKIINQNFERPNKGGNTIYSAESTNSCQYYKGIQMPSNYTETQCIERASLYDFTKPNDININVINNLLMKESSLGSYIELTEWVNSRSDYMVKEGGKKKVEYTYDNRGNIVKATGNNGVGTFVVTIEYVE